MTTLSRRNQHSKRQADKQATEQREAWKDRVKPGKVNELDALSREDILGRIQALLQSDRTLLPELVAMQARK